MKIDIDREKFLNSNFVYTIMEYNGEKCYYIHKYRMFGYIGLLTEEEFDIKYKGKK